MGGTERVILQLATILKDVVIIVPGTTLVAFNGYDNLNIKSLNISDFPTSGKFNKLSHRMRYLQALMKNIKLTSKDFVVTFSYDLNILNIILSRKYQCKSIVCEHIEYGYHKGIRNIFRKFFYKQAGVKLVCLTKTDERKFKNDGIDTVVIPNFIYPVESEYKENTNKIIAVGRLEYQKNLKFLVDAFKLSRVYENGWTLEIIGEGSEHRLINETIKLHGLDSYVKIYKFSKDIEKYYRNSSLLCMTSRFEAFPMVLLEGMNYGLPVLVSDFPTGAKEILGPENTQIVSEYNIDSYASHLKTICSNVDLRKMHSDENLALIKNYHPEKIAKLWIELFHDS
ncbi:MULTISPECIES: glycosyltransferase [Acinetobacter]|nr:MULTISPECIES: glycosyltransferase [Acinetobacter]MDH1916207.1 glycosyltransferase [Acinetobacter junii]